MDFKKEKALFAIEAEKLGLDTKEDGIVVAFASRITNFAWEIWVKAKLKGNNDALRDAYTLGFMTAWEREPEYSETQEFADQMHSDLKEIESYDRHS